VVYLIASESAELCGRNLRRRRRLVFCPLYFCVVRCVFCVARDLKSDDVNLEIREEKLPFGECEKR
jgi:hypothetical protein